MDDQTALSGLGQRVVLPSRLTKRSLLTRTTRGFTIVELLIVIVIIGILAAITIVAYNGIQERAKSSSVISTANAYIKALRLWATDNSTYPVPGGSDIGTCLGAASDFPSNVCANAPAWGTNTNYDPIFNQKLSSYMGGRTLPYGYWAGSPQGLSWYHSNYYGLNHAVLFYAVGPNTDCGIGNIQAPNGQPPDGRKYTFRDTVSTTCIVQLN